MHDRRKKIVIVGGGASGTLLALRGISEWIDTDICIIEQSGNFGTGLAYAPSAPEFLLNVPAEKMGAFAEQPDHFFRWINTEEKIWRPLSPLFRDVKYGATDFVPRMIYGAYLVNLLEQAVKVAGLKGNRLHLIHDGVLNIVASKEKDFPLIVATTSKKMFLASAVVIATGNSFSRSYHPSSTNVFSSPYDDGFLNRAWQDSDHILLLGSGLSMVDAVCYLSAKGYRGKITGISKNALKPLPHRSGTSSIDPPFNAHSRPDRASLILREIRKSIKEASAKKIPWQAIIDSLRPFSNDLWLSLPVSEQKRLWRILPWWNSARHRIPAFSDQCINSMSGAEQYKLRKGRIRSVEDGNYKVKVTLEDGSTIAGTAAVHCLGFDYNVRNLQSLCPDIPLPKHWSGNLSLPENKSFSLSAEYPLYAIGPMFFGHYIESTAIPDIRSQALILAQCLSNELRR